MKGIDYDQHFELDGDYYKKKVVREHQLKHNNTKSRFGNRKSDDVESVHRVIQNLQYVLARI